MYRMMYELFSVPRCYDLINAVAQDHVYFELTKPLCMEWARHGLES